MYLLSFHKDLISESFPYKEVACPDRLISFLSQYFMSSIQSDLILLKTKKEINKKLKIEENESCIINFYSNMFFGV